MKILKIMTTIAAVLLLLPLAAFATNPYLLKDINVTVIPGSSSPTNCVIFAGQLYFAASTPDHGTELWKSNGTPAGTTLVKDINPGGNSSAPSSITVVGTTLFFSANDGTNGEELWKSDGTTAGTVMIREINAAPGAGSSPTNLTALGTTLFFTATDSLGTELWMSDGTSKGTVMVADINPGAGSSSPSYLTAFGGYIYFEASDEINGSALWRTNGTITTMITATENLYPGSLTVMGSYIYFMGYDDAHGYEVWRTNGTTTTRISDIYAGTGSSYPSYLTVVGSVLYFQAYDATNGYALWQTAGSTPTLVSGTANMSPSSLTAMGSSYLYFQGYDATHGYELWRTDGSTTVRISDINPGTGNSYPTDLTVMGSYLYFQAYDAINGYALWRTNGADPTMTSGTAGMSPAYLTVMGGYLYFQGYDTANGTELRRTDGITVSLVNDTNGLTVTASSSPANLTAIGSTLYFTANDGVNGTELWKYNGTTATLIDINPGPGSSSPANLTVLGSTLYFTATHPNYGTELWKYNGTTASVIDINPGTTGSNPANLEVVGSTLYFTATHPSYGTEPWKYNGTTATVHDIVTGTGSSSPSNLTAVGSIDLFFTANDGINGTELWRVQTSGTPFMVKNINANAGAGSGVSNLKAIGLTLYFTANDGTNGTELWTSNGLDSGTTMVKNINPGSGSSTPAYLTSVGSTLFFRANDGTNGYELWKSDGTVSGTTIVRDIYPGAGSSSPSNLATVGSTLYFSAMGSVDGMELWRSDGTSTGTTLVRDINSGTGSSYPAYLTPVGTSLYFQAYTPNTGYELWRSDGTAAGTIVVGEINPGPVSAYPAHLTVINNIVYFQAQDSLFGYELFAFDTTYPTGSISTGSSVNYTPTTSITLNLSCNDPGGSCSQMQFSTEGINWTTAEAYAAAKAWTLPTGDGPYMIYVRFCDNSGNWSSPYPIRIVLDTTTPQTYLTYYPTATTATKSTTFHFSSQETASFQCWLDEDAAGYQPCTSPWTATLYGGSHIFKVRAVDLAGHVDPTPASYEWSILDNIGQTAFAWGKNTFGQLGNGETGKLTNEVVSQVKGAMGFISIAAGGAHSVGVRNDGTVWTWGSNAYGQLGYGYPNNSALPQQIEGLKDVISISAGTAFTLAVKSDGTVWIWGKNPASGTVIPVPQQVAGLSSITAVSAGDHHALALSSGGTVWAWGTDTLGELGQNSFNFIQTTPVQVRDSVGILTGIRAISAGKEHSLAIKNNISDRFIVMTWGSNSSEQLGISVYTSAKLLVATELATPAGMCDAISIAAGETHSAFAFTSTTTTCGDSPPYAYTAGAYGDGELANGDQWGNNCSAPCKVTSVANVAKVAVSKNNTYIMTDADVVWAAGNNQYGQLGTGLHDNLNHYTPTKVGYLSGAEEIAAGSGFALSLKTAWNTGAADTTANSGKYTSLAVDSSDKVHISYSSNGFPAYTTNVGGAWTSTVIDPAIETRSTALALDSSNNPHVCSLSWNGSNVVIRYMTKSGGIWQAPVTIANLTDNPGVNIGSRCDIAVQGTNVYIAYIDASTPATNPQGRGILKLARKVGTTWTVYSVDDPVTLNRYAGLHLSLAVDTSGYAHITYKYQSGEFRYAYVLPGNTPNISLITVASFSDTHLTLDSNNKAHVSYCGYTANGQGLRYATNASGSWVHTTIDESEPDLCETGFATSIAFRKGDSTTPYISYYDAINEDLKVAYFKNGKWIKSGVDTDGVVGKYSSIGIDSLNKVHVSYYNDTEPEFNLRYASSSDYVRPTGSITINGGATYTTSTDAVLSLTCSDGVGGIGCWQMKFSLDSGATWSFPEPFTTIKTISLPAGNGAKPVQVRFEDSANNWSQIYSQSIILDTTAATGTVAINGNPVPDRTKSGLVLLNLTASDTNSVTEMSLSNDGSTWYTFPYATSFGWSLSAGDGTKIVLAKFKDAAGNWSNPAADTILLDSTAPVSSATPGGGSKDTAISINLLCIDGSGSGCATTYYTTDGTVPGSTSERYTGAPIQLSGLQNSMQLKFFSVDALGNAETVKTETYTFIAGFTTLTLDTPPTLLQNGLLDVSGKLTRYPDSQAVPNNGMDLSGLPVTLTVTGPAGSPCVDGCSVTDTIDAQGLPHPIVTYSSLGHYKVERINTFSHPGIYTISAHFAGTGLHTPASSVTESLLVGASAGYAVIVEGKVSTDEGLASHNKTTNRIYATLKERGFEDDNIIYFNYGFGMVPGVDGLPDKTDIQYTIENWARERLNGAPAPLYLIFVDHGNSNTFYIHPDTITPTELNSWITTMENGLNDAARLQKRILILGACYSGSFLNQLTLAPVPGINAGRITISSAAADEQSYKGPNEPDGIRSGEFFIEELFKSLKKGSSLRSAFIDASSQTRSFTSQGGNATNSVNGYNDSAVQHPLLDDNGDGVGSNSLLDAIGDGNESAAVFLGVGATNAVLGPADIKSVTATRYLPSTDVQTLLEAEVYSNAAVSSAWIEVKAPTNVLESVPFTTGQLDLVMPRWAMTLNGAAWQAAYGSDPYRSQERFDIPGRYEIFYFTKSKNAEISEMRRSLVYKNYPGNGAPAPFNLIAPANASDVSTEFNMVWQPSSDPDGLTYTVQIATDGSSENAFNSSIIFQKEEVRPSWYRVESGAGLKDATSYFWRVIAIDSFGEQRSSQIGTFFTNNTNALPGRIRGYVYDNGSVAVVGATVTAKVGSSIVAQTVTTTGGAFVFVVPSGSYKLTATAAGYADGTSGDFTLASGGTTDTSVTITVGSPSLQVTTSGSGSGTVSSNSGGIACSSGSSINCTAPYGNGTSVTLTATPDWKSLFGGWSGAYVGSDNPLIITMSYHKSLTATFTPNLQARVVSSDFATLQGAYNTAADGATIKARVYTFKENLLLDQSRTIIIAGGKDAAYNNVPVGITTVDGSITIRQGRLEVTGPVAIK